MVGDLTQDDWRVIRQSSLFGRLDPVAAHDLIGDGAVLAAPRGVTICHQDEPAAHYFIVLSGLIKLYRRAVDGSIAIISIHGPSHNFMEAEALTGATCSTTAEAVVDTRIARIDAAKLRHRAAGKPLNVLGVDKFPRMVDYVTPSGVRITGTRRAGARAARSCAMVPS